MIQAIVSGDPETFYDREIAEREKARLPPFGRMAALIVSASDRAAAEGHARSLRRVAPAARDIAVLGPAEAPMALIRGRYRFRLLVHGARQSDLQAFVARMIEAAPVPRGSVRVQIDIDPQSFM